MARFYGDLIGLTADDIRVTRTVTAAQLHLGPVTVSVERGKDAADAMDALAEGAAELAAWAWEGSA